jgi:hypothetical protein
MDAWSGFFLMIFPFFFRCVSIWCQFCLQSRILGHFSWSGFFLMIFPVVFKGLGTSENNRQNHQKKTAPVHWCQFGVQSRILGHFKEVRFFFDDFSGSF